MRRLTYFLIACFCAAGLTLGCQMDDKTDSETHWQRAMYTCSQDSDCPDDLNCICGGCTTTCTSDQTVCDGFAGQASCVTAPSDLDILCGSAGSLPDSICVGECVDGSDCGINQTCTGGYCKPTSTQMPDPDGGDGDSPDNETSTYEDPCGDEGMPECCSADIYYEDDLHARFDYFGSVVEPLFEGESVPTGTFETTWAGVVDRPMTSVPCPPRASEMGVWCQVDYAVEFRNPDFRAYLGLPREELASLAMTGTRVKATHLANPSSDFDSSALETLTRTNGDLLLDLVGSQSTQQSPIEFVRDDYTLRTVEVADDYSNVRCMTERDRCSNVYGLRPVHLDTGNQSIVLEPFSTHEFGSASAQYSTRFFTATERLLEWPGCASGRPVVLDHVTRRVTSAGECDSTQTDACPSGFQCVHTVNSSPPYCSTDWIGECLPVPDTCDDPDPSADVCECETSTSYASECHAREAGFRGRLAPCSN